MNLIARLFSKYRELVMYIVIGAFTTLVNVGVYRLFTIIGVNYLVSDFIAWVVAVIFAYFANRKYVFLSNNGNVLTEFLRFVLSRVFSGVVDMLIMYVMVDVLFIDDMIAKVVAMLVSTALNYITGKFLVFKNKASKNDGGQDVCAEETTPE